MSWTDEGGKERALQFVSLRGHHQRQLRLRPPEPPPAWDGQFHALLYHVPERGRAFRDRLRRHATIVGYGILQPGVLIAVRDRSGELTGALADPPEGTVLHRGRIAVAEPATAAAIAWELPAHASPIHPARAGLRALVAGVRAARSSPASSVTVRERIGGRLSEYEQVTPLVEVSRSEGHARPTEKAGMDGESDVTQGGCTHRSRRTASSATVRL